MASVALYALLCVIWGSTWLVIKIGYGGLGPFTVAALRFLLAGALLTIVVPALGARWPRGRVEWSVVLCVGVVLFGADYGLIYWGEQFIDSGLTAILFATLPLFTVALAHVYIPGDHITPRKLAGTLLAFLGVVALFGESLRLDADTLGAMAAIIVATVFAARRKHVDGNRLPGRGRQRCLVSCLFLAAQDVECDEPQLHQCLHAGDRTRARIHLSQRAADALDGGGCGADSGGCRFSADAINFQIPTPNDQPLPIPNFQAFVILDIGIWKLEVVGRWELVVRSYFTLAGSDTPPADPPRKRRLPSASTKFRPTAFCVPSLA